MIKNRYELGYDETFRIECGRLNSSVGLLPLCYSMNKHSKHPSFYGEIEYEKAKKKFGSCSYWRLTNVPPELW